MQKLRDDLAAIAAAYSGTCTWALTDLATGAHIGQDEDAVMPAASLIKVPILVALYRAVDDRQAPARRSHVLRGAAPFARIRRACAHVVRRRDDRARRRDADDHHLGQQRDEHLRGPGRPRRDQRAAWTAWACAQTRVLRRWGEPRRRERPARPQLFDSGRHDAPALADRPARVRLTGRRRGHAAHPAPAGLPTRAFTRPAVERMEHAGRRPEGRVGRGEGRRIARTASARAAPSSRARAATS